MLTKQQTLELLHKINNALTDALNIWDRIEKDTETRVTQSQQEAA